MTDPGSRPERGSLARLHPIDGMLLRSTHLDRIQGYAASLSTALGRAGGHGVVSGYRVRLDPGRAAITVDPGLAVNGDGRPLLLETTATVDLSGLSPGPGDLRLVVATYAEVPFGQEEVYGELCGDPSAAPAPQHAYVSESARVEVRPVSVGSVDTADLTRRSQVADAWFERERQEAHPWIGADATPLTARDWADPPAEPRPAEVALALLLWTSKGWVLDTWTVRRERVDPPARRGWESRLGLRPWSVFLAQLLQFEDMLADALDHAAPRDATDEYVLGRLRTARSRLRRGRSASLRDVNEAMDALQAVQATQLRDLGIAELPPAGFLPVVPCRGSVEQQVTRLFGDSATLRFRRCPADAVPEAVEEARHRDRIALSGAGAVVEILVPHAGESEPSWVGFRRWAECTSGEPSCSHSDVVDVYLCTVDDVSEFVSTFLAAPELPPTPSATLREVTYPPGGWALPEGQEEIESWRSPAGGMTAVALTPSAGRLPLVAGRAVMLLHPFGGASAATVPEYRTRVWNELDHDVIVLVKPTGLS
ncbi:hypothetical protein [Nonomuraea sp. NPDC050783]|uniref:hypothetical protein n=1 Tax=Nonomuraea sp. NPDC050783 TaxID=3154634 RepID=UPI0034673BD7